jgi:3-hydroxyisobutyrate dehydrogenase-like beta-hydroxyacid dehydrogenase
VLFGPNGVARSMPAGSLIVIHSTLAPAEVLELARLASTEFGLRLVDAPVSGGAIKAAHGEMVVMLGGDPADVEECRPVLATFASRIIYLGPVGAGQQAKLINNAALSAHLGIASDAMAVGAEFGLDRAALAEVLVNGSGRSYGIEMLAGAGGLSAVARTQARPTLGKDVRLLAEVLNDSAAGGSLLAVAGKTVDRLDGLSAEPG